MGGTRILLRASCLAGCAIYLFLLWPLSPDYANTPRWSAEALLGGLLYVGLATGAAAVLAHGAETLRRGFPRLARAIALALVPVVLVGWWIADLRADHERSGADPAAYEATGSSPQAEHDYAASLGRRSNGE